MKKSCVQLGQDELANPAFSFLCGKALRPFLLIMSLSWFVFGATYAQAQIWINPMTCGTPIATRYVGDTIGLGGNFYINFEIGQTSWNSSQVGIGMATSGSGYNWGAALYYQHGSGNNRRVRRNVGSIVLTNAGNWYVICQARSGSSGAHTSRSGCGWSDSTTYPPSNLAESYFNVLAIGNPSGISATPASGTEIGLTWTRGSTTSARNTVIVRNTSGTFTTPTAGSAPPAVGGSFAGGTVVYNGSGSSHNDTGLSPGTTYYYRLFAINNNYYSSGENADASTPEVPVITVQGGTLAFGDVGVGDPSSAQSYTVSGAHVTGNITVTAPTHFQVSLSSGSGFGTSVSLPAAGGTVWARYAPSAATSHSDNITHTATGADTVNKPVTGTGWTVPSAPTVTASSSPSLTGFTANWAASSGATGYRLDVATDPAFANMVSGYNNANVGTATSEAVSAPVVGHYYYRVRAVNPVYTSVNSATMSGYTSTVDHRNAPNGGAPYVSPSTIFVGDTVTFGSRAWGLINPGNQWGRARLWIHTGPTVQDGFSGDWTGFTDSGERYRDHQFTAAGTYYWGMQLNYGDYGTNFWYTRDEPEWTPMLYNGTNGNLTVTVNALTPPTGLSATPISASQINLGWTKSGDRNVMIVRRMGSAVTWTPTQGTSYTDGQIVGVDHVVVRASTSGTVRNDTGLESGTTYHYALFSENYGYYSASATTSATTPLAAPSTQASSISFSSVGLTSMNVSWNNGNGSRRVVVAREGSAVNASPSDGSTYTASDIFGSGQHLGNGNYVVYEGTGSSFSLTGLGSGRTYHLRVFEYNGTGGNTLYNTTTPSGNPNSQATIQAPRGQDPATANPTTAYLGDTVQLHIDSYQSWPYVSGNPARSWAIILTKYENPDLSSGSTAGPGRNPGSSANDTWALTPQLTQVGTYYWLMSVSYQFGNDFFYDELRESWSQLSVSRTSDASLSIEVLPLGEPTDVTATQATSSAIDLDWTKWSGRNVLIVRRQGAAVTWTPTQGSSYSNGQDLGNNTFVVHNSTGQESLTDSGLTSDTTYHYRIFSENYLYYSDGVATSATTGSGPTPPILASPTVSSITANSATLGATISSMGGSSITSRGTVWGENPEPTGNSEAAGGTATGSFTMSRTGLPAGTLIYFRGYAVNSIGTGYSPDGSFWTAPPAPNASAASSVGGTTFVANWSAAQGATGYRLDVATDSGFTSMVSGQNNRNVGDVTSASVTGLSPDTVYYYRVRAYNSGGTGASSGTISLQTLDVQIPDPPTSQPATPVTASSFTATWAPSSGATEYILEVASNPNFSNATTINVGNTTSYTVNESGSLYYRVRAVNQEGSSSPSSSIGVVRHSVSPGFQMMAPPLLTDRAFDGALGNVLAEGLASGDQVHVWHSSSQSWSVLTLNGNGDWDGQSGLVLDPGQGFFVQRNSGSPASFNFTGPVGNNADHTITIRPNWNLIGLSEGRNLTINNAFSSPDSGSVVANWNDSQADQVIFQNSDGSWRRFYRTPNGWFDFGTGTINNTFSLTPGRAYYYKRHTSGGDMVVRF